MSVRERTRPALGTVVFAAMTKPSLRDTLIFIVILSLVVAAMFALAFGLP